MASTTRRRRSSYDAVPHWITRKRMVLGVVAAALLVAGTYGFRLSLALAHAFHTNPVSAILGALSGGNGSAVQRQARSLQRINIMLYGYGGDGHDGAYLSDSIMLVSIQPEPNGPPEVAEISIPRDWYVPIQLGKGKERFGRINEGYEDGMFGWGPEPATAQDAGAAVADATIEHLLGVNVDHWVGVDFDAFKEAVDAVGGVDINVPVSFTDTQYPAGECDEGDCGFMTVSFNAGEQHMDGATALIYARSRHGNNGEGSDFARSKRQQQIITALKQKVVSIGGIGNLPDLLNALGDNVMTDLQIGDVESLYGLVQNVDPNSIEHVSIDDTNFLYDCGYPTSCGAYYLYANDSSFGSLQHYIQNIFPAAGVQSQHAPVTFLDASGGGHDASGRWAKLMNMLELNCSDGGTAPQQAATTVIDESNGKEAATADWLAHYFGVSVTKQAPSPSASGSAATDGVVVVLGSQEEQSFLGNPGVGT